MFIQKGKQNIIVIKIAFLNIIKKVIFDMKKLKSFFIIFILLISITFNIYAFDEKEAELELKYFNEIQGEITEASTNPSEEPETYSRAVVVYDRYSKTIIYGKNENDVRAMASTTKIMTAIVLLENADLSQTVEVSKKAGGTGGSRLGLKAGDKITLNDLLYGLMLCSGNDAAVQIAETVGGSIEGFAEMMNKKARELGLNNTSFVTPHGLDENGHHTTAYELAVLTDYALNNPTFAKVVNTKYYTVSINGTPKDLSNTNELLGYLQGVNGVKTGFTNNALRCLVTSTKRGDFNIITVVLGADTKKIRTMDSIKLIEYTYENYELIDISKLVENEYEKWRQNYKIEINKGVKSEVQTKLGEQKYKIYPVKKTDKENIQIEISDLHYAEAPLLNNTKLGSIEVKINGQKIYTVDIFTAEEIRRKDVKDYFFNMLGVYAQM